MQVWFKQWNSSNKHRFLACLKIEIRPENVTLLLSFLAFKIVCLFCFTLFFQHKDAYQVILDGVKGGTKEKRLAAQFIPKFFKHFPELADSAINAQLDLCEDEDVSVSHGWSLWASSQCFCERECHWRSTQTCTQWRSAWLDTAPRLQSASEKKC